LFDDTGQQLSQNYRAILNDYKKTVKQRNNILKEQKENYIERAVLESWDENLIVLGAMLFVFRQKFYTKLIKETSFYYSRFIKNEILTSKYIASFENEYKTFTDLELCNLEKSEVEELLRQKLKQVESQERARAKTIVGPHRDEIQFLINGMDARQFASQGQQRNIALALKLGQLSLVRKIGGNQPILLLDDVMSELDESRRGELIKIINDDILTIVTATDLKFFNKKLLDAAQILRLS
jgi:DNA replication and repair protein RecF